VRLHTGDPSVFGAVREQIDELCKLNIDYDALDDCYEVFAS
jgi:precorrin-4/cobalt-precorrin-4 C11-methyltransferase